MNETLDAIRTRYACRSYTGEPVPPETLRKIAEAAVQAPSAMNRQPWRIILTGNKSIVDELDVKGLEALKAKDPAGYERILGRGGKLLYNAPAMIIIAKERLTGPFSADLDAGIATANIILAARSLGVDSVVCGLAGYAFNGPDGEAIKAQFGFPPNFDFGIAVLLGYATASGQPHEPDLAKIIEIA